jgi:apolipoprotein N-acyltransferase
MSLFISATPHHPRAVPLQQHGGWRSNFKLGKAEPDTRGPEREHLTSSGRDVHEVFDTPIGKVGLLICWDLAFPEAFRELIAGGAKIMYVFFTSLIYLLALPLVCCGAVVV